MVFSVLFAFLVSHPQISPSLFFLLLTPLYLFLTSVLFRILTTFLIIFIFHLSPLTPSLFLSVVLACLCVTSCSLSPLLYQSVSHSTSHITSSFVLSLNFSWFLILSFCPLSLSLFSTSFSVFVFSLPLQFLHLLHCYQTHPVFLSLLIFLLTHSLFLHFFCLLPCLFFFSFFLSFIHRSFCFSLFSIYHPPFLLLLLSIYLFLYNTNTLLIISL